MIQKIRERLPEIAVILLCMVILGVGVSQKEGYHMDELLSFELANAEFNPWIVPTQPEGRLAKFVHNEIDGETLGETVGNLVDVVKDVIQNRGNSLLLSYTADVYEEPAWISKEQFQDYIYVDNRDDFNYLSVYFNVKDDNHPPIHFMLLHTLSSLFQGRVHPFMGCAINMLAVAITMGFLMKLGYLLTKALGMEKRGRQLGILAALLYGVSTGALASVLLIRMYCVMTCLCVALFYCYLQKWQQREFEHKNKGLIAVTVLGFLTQYFFLFYCLVLAAVTAVLLWCQKRTKELLIYIRSMFFAAIIGLVIFPFAILDVFSSERGVEALGNLSQGLSGYGARLTAFWNILRERTFDGELFLLLVVLVLCFFWYYGKANKCKPVNVREELLGCRKWIHSNLSYILLLIIPQVGYFLLAARMSPYLVDRYIMALFPFVILTGTVLVVGLAHYIEKRTGEKNILTVVCVILVALQLFGLLEYDGTYLYRGYRIQEQVAEEYAETPCICVYEGVGYYENLLELAQYKKSLLVTYNQLESRRETASIEELEEVVLLIKQNVDTLQVCDLMSQKYDLVLKEELLENSVYGDRICLFERK